MTGFFIFNTCIPMIGVAEQEDIAYVQISTAQEFLDFMSSISSDDSVSAVLLNDIDLKDVCSEENPLPQVTNEYNGIFDGAGYSLYSVYDSDSVFADIGENGVLKNLGISGTANGLCTESRGTIENISSGLTVYGNDKYAAGISAKNSGTIKNSSYTGELFSNGKTASSGGITAVNSGEILNCDSLGVISGSLMETAAKSNYIGGICGKNTGSIYECQNNASITGNQYIGGITGENSGLINRSKNNATITAEAGYGAGIAGINTSSDAKVQYCDNYGSITVKTNYCGGICGQSSSAVLQCTNYGKVTGNKYAGGICGLLKTTEGSAEECINNGTINANEFVGGIAGSLQGTMLSACVNNGEIYARRSVGGIIGIAAAANSDAGTITIESCINRGTINENADGDAIINFIGGIIGDTTNNIVSVIVNNCANTGNIYLNNTTGGILGGIHGTVTNCFTKGNISRVAARYTEVKNNYVYSAGSAEDYTNGALVEKLGAEYWEQGTEYPIPKAVSELGVNHTDLIKTGSDITLNISDKSDIAVDIKVSASSCGSYAPFDISPTYSNGKAYLLLPSSADLSNIEYYTVNRSGDVIDTYTGDFSDGKSANVKIKGLDMEITAYQSKLPTVYMDIDEQFGTIEDMDSSPGHSAKTWGDMIIEVPQELAEQKGWKTYYKSIENDPDKNCTVEMRGRGNSSWTTDPAKKRSYQVKMEKKQSLLGMDTNKTWILLQDSVLLAGQKLGLDFAQDMGITNTPQSEFVDVYINGRYHGNMLLTEKVQVNSSGVNISDLDDEYKDNGKSTENLDLTGGYLLEVDNFSGDDLRILTNNNIISVKSPEDLAKSVSSDDGNPYKYINDLMSDLFTAIYSEDGKMADGTSFLEHIDIESFVRYYWHQEFLGNTDCGIGSTFFYKDKDSIDPKIYAGPVWDNDRILQRNGWVAKNIRRKDAFHPESDAVYNQLMKHKEFVSYVIYYYEHGIRDILQNATKYIDDYSVYMSESADMDYLRWGINKFNPAYMKNKLTERAAWIDEHYTELMTEAIYGEEIDVTLPVHGVFSYQISDMKFKSADDTQILDSIPVSDDFIVEANIQNTGDTAGILQFIAALFDENRNMIKVSSAPVSIQAAGAATVKMSIPALGMQADSIKLFLWNNLSDMQPASYTFSANGK